MHSPCRLPPSHMGGRPASGGPLCYALAPMGRLFFIVLVNLGAYLVLRQLWPSIRDGWRRQAFLGLSGLSVLSVALPLALGLGHHGALPVVGTPLKLFGSGWLI